jgi:hypothetical protein
MIKSNLSNYQLKLIAGVMTAANVLGYTLDLEDTNNPTHILKCISLDGEGTPIGISTKTFTHNDVVDTVKYYANTGDLLDEITKAIKDKHNGIK